MASEASEAVPYEYAVWSATWRGGMRADVQARGHALAVDEPPEFGGEDTGPMPTELLTAALASCMCLAIVFAARKRRLELPDLEVRVLPVRAPGEPRYGAYEVTVRSSAEPDGLAKAVELAKRYCWVTNTLHNPPELTYRITAS